VWWQLPPAAWKRLKVYTGGSGSTGRCGDRFCSNNPNPSSKSLLPRIAARGPTWNVVRLDRGSVEKLKTDTVYVCPPQTLLDFKATASVRPFQTRLRGQAAQRDRRISGISIRRRPRATRGVGITFIEKGGGTVLTATNGRNPPIHRRSGFGPYGFDFDGHAMPVMERRRGASELRSGRDASYDPRL